MTPQEVYNKLQARYVFIAEGIFDSYEITDELFSALEKQIPKKLIINEKDGMRHCPNCDTFFLSGGKRHCERCGQALDWSEEE